ncbi:radical SAM/SPASM domain-containing protein [Porphyromonadaceae sp. NP-X]|jgi:radical SAM protein with 4Fe4S-binding SPASM domain|nr:radical SAM/SPASM domain-containing protein [Porphyromonadaceae sp. NP-X]
MFKKIYIEITNSCNFHCSFCFSTTQPTRFISVKNFQTIVEKIKPYTNYIYLHVLGEPLLHPQLEEILNVAEREGMNVNITTNGSLLKARKELILNHPIRQLNISLHDAEENIPAANWESFFENILDMAVEFSPQTYVNLRLWNINQPASEKFNSLCKEKISERFLLSPAELISQKKGKSIQLDNHIFLQQLPKFQWPTENGKILFEHKSCYALRDHIAILSGGEVVPCCLDAGGSLKLGNIFSQDLSSILSSEKATRMRQGFQQHKITESFCKTCGFRVSL